MNNSLEKHYKMKSKIDLNLENLRGIRHPISETPI